MNHVAAPNLHAATLLTNGESHIAPKGPRLSPTRQHLMRRIGIFELVDGEYVGHIATLHFKCQAIIKDNPYRTSTAEPAYVVLVKNPGAEILCADLGYAWDKTTDSNHVPYMTVHLDDPSFPKTIVAVLIKGHDNVYNLFWDRVTINDEDIETQFVSEELKPYVAVLRPLENPPSQYLLSIYPSLAEIWDPD